MSSEAIDVVTRIYGYDWASAGDREKGLAAAAGLFAPRFELRLDPTAFGDRTVTDRFGVEMLIQGIEEDFRELRLRADRIVEAGENEAGELILVLGEAVGRGRLSGLPFRSPFGHLWTVKDRQAAHVVAYLDHELALAAVDLAKGG